MEWWNTGDEVLLRELWRGRVWSATPAVVVQDGPGERRFFVPIGTPVKYAVDEEGRELRLYADRWRLADHVTKRSFLSFSWPDDSHAVLALWDPDWSFSGWYINLEAPLGRSGRCYDFLDHCLDALVPPDRTTWSWKDEEELEEAVRRGIFSSRQAADVRAEGERAVRRLLGGEPPFDRDWSTWRPDPAWPIPRVIVGSDSALPGR